MAQPQIPLDPKLMNSIITEQGFKFKELSTPGALTLLMINCMKEYGRRVRDLTLDWAAENAGVDIDEATTLENVSVHKGSILAGKKAKELDI